jgi:diacylglycerol O-acyltransferase-1
VLISRLSLGLVSAVLACGLYCITCLKLISYIQVNSWCRQPSPAHRLQRKSTAFASSGKLPPDSADKKDDNSLVVHPANLTVRDMAYFCLAPTLCYELNFPRTARVRKLFLLRRLAEVVIGTNLILALTQQWIVPVVINSLVPFSGSDLPLATERLIRLALPNHVIWLLGGFILFHSGLNIAGELLRFADRDFYHDWWNSPNVSKFWQNWNLPVHRWFVRHLFKPLLAAGWSRGSAIMAVFLVSSFFHEYLVSVPLRMFKPWLFLGFMCNVPLVLLSGWLEETLGPRAGNLSMWLCLVLGQPLLVMAYYHDYVVENHGHSLIHHYGRLSSAPL